MGAFFHAVVYQPIYNLLVFFYNFFPWGDFGVAIIALTLVLKFAMYPLSKKQIKSQKALQELQPKIKEVQERYKKDKQEQAKRLMALYKENGVNPAAGCLPLIIQLVILITIYRVIISITGNNLTVNPADLYPFVANPGQINHLFFGLVDLAKPEIILAVLTAAAQYWQTKMLMPASVPAKASQGKDTKEEIDPTQMMMKQMLYIGPLLTLWIGATFPAGLSLYWFVSTIFAIIQQRLLIPPISQKTASPAA